MSNFWRAAYHGGPEFQVNTYTNDEQSNYSIAAFNNNNLIVAWDSEDQVGSGGDIFGQIFDDSGARVGREFQLSDYTIYNSYKTSLAGLKNGNAVLASTSYNEDGSEEGIKGVILDKNGDKIGPYFRVNTYTAYIQWEPSVASFNNGNFVITWESYNQEGERWRCGVYGQIFDENGIKVGNEFQINTYTPERQKHSSTAVLANDNFAVVWESEGQDGSQEGIYGQVFDATGVKIGGEFQVNTYTTFVQQVPSIAPLNNGNFVITWHSHDQDGSPYSIYGQIINGVGSKVGDEFKVNTYSAGEQNSASVTTLTNSNFVVVWTSSKVGTDNYYGVCGQIFDETGTKIDNELQINVYTTSTQTRPEIVSIGNNFIVVWQSYGQDGSQSGIYGRVFCPSSSLYSFNTGQTLGYIQNIPINLEAMEIFSPTTNVTVTMTFSDVTAGELNEDSSGSVTSTFTSSLGEWKATGNTADINILLSRLRFTPATDYKSDFFIDVLVDDGSNSISNTIVVNEDSTVITTMTEPILYKCNYINIAPALNITAIDDNLESAKITMFGDVNLSEDFLSFVDQNGITGNYDNTLGELTLSGTASIANYQKALRDVKYQNTGFVLPDKSVTVSFVTNDGTYDSITATKEINNSGVIKNCGSAYGGPEFQVNSYTKATQYSPSIAALNNGNFVVTWYSVLQDGSGTGIYAQIFDKNASKLGNEFQVNTYTSNDQILPTVTTLNNGNFVISWYSEGQDGSRGTICAQIFDESGSKVSGEFQANSHTDQGQMNPSVASLKSGGFVIIWQSEGQESTNNWGIYGQIFDEAGSKVGNEFHVNSYTSNEQLNPSVVGLTSGNFVVTWKSNGQDGSSYGIFGQIFNASGTPIGNEFQVNTYTYSAQRDSSVAAFSNGNFIVTWTSLGLDGYSGGIAGQIFDGSANKVGAEFQCNAHFLDTQEKPSIAVFADDGFVVTWNSFYQDGSQSGVYGQTFDSSANKIGGEFQANIFTSSDQMNSSVAVLTNGNFVITWSSASSQDGNGEGVFARIFCSSFPLCALNTAQTLNYIEDIPRAFIPIKIFSPYPNITATMAFNSTAGSLNEWSATGATSLYNSGLGEWKAFGALDGVNDILSDLTFTPAANYNGDFKIDFFLEDGSSPSITGIINVMGTAINDAPVITLDPAIHLYTCDNRAIDDTIIITDIENNYLQSGKVMLSGDFNAKKDFLEFTDQNGITGEYDNINGELVLTGIATTEDYQEVLKNVTYDHKDIFNSENSLMASFVVNDGTLDSNIATKNIAVDGDINCNDAPVITLDPAIHLHTCDNRAIDDTITIADIDNDNLQSAKVTLSEDFNAKKDSLEFIDQNGIAGEYDNINGELLLTGIATTEDYQEALRNVTYSHKGLFKSENSLMASFMVNDGTLDSNIVTKNIVADGDINCQASSSAGFSKWAGGGIGVAIATCMTTGVVISTVATGILSWTMYKRRLGCFKKNGVIPEVELATTSQTDGHL